tara:strand:- start:189 stop:446 length:258 start_codon:yes stop_codon:yes gene_type:complete
MYKVIADYMAIGLWGVSVSNTIFSSNYESAVGFIQLVLSILGVVYLIVKIYNEVSGQILDRERKRIENEMSLRDLLDDGAEELTK